jgi:hypothetical protein
MTENEYLQKRWQELSIETKRLLRLNAPDAQSFMIMLWRMQDWRDKS